MTAPTARIAFAGRGWYEQLAEAAAGPDELDGRVVIFPDHPDALWRVTHSGPGWARLERLRCSWLPSRVAGTVHTLAGDGHRGALVPVIVLDDRAAARRYRLDELAS